MPLYRFFRQQAIIALTMTALLAAAATEVYSSPGDSPFAGGSVTDADLFEVGLRIAAKTVRPGMSYSAFLTVNVADGWHINSASPTEDWLIAAALEFENTASLSGGSVQYPTAESVQLGENLFSVYSGQFEIPFKITVADNAPSGEASLPVKFTYQPCNDRECRSPVTTELTVALTISADGDIGTETGGNESNASTVGTQDAADRGELQSLISEYGFWGYLMALGLAFVTGLLLSFSPCTYPMIPITVSIFAGSERGMGRGFVLSLFFVGSMAVIYGIMGLIVSLVGGVFGAWLASPGVVIGIAVVFVIFSLSMFGLYDLNVPMWLRQKLGTKKGGGGVAGSIVMGAVAALVVSPCVGPFVAGILLYVATSGSPILGFLILFVFAFGLGSLYMLIGTFSSAINQLPGAGGWMETVKKFFGFVLLIMAVYFLRTIVPTWVTALLTALLLLALGVFGGGLDRLTSESPFFDRLRKFIGLLATVVGVYLLIGLLFSEGFIFPPARDWFAFGDGSHATESHSLINWTRNLEDGLEKARLENKPALIDTWATWCVNCRVLDKKTFGNPGVAAEAARFVAIKVQLEKAGTQEVESFMRKFGLKQYSLPTTLLLDSKGNVQKIMQGVVEPEDMIAEMKKVN